MEIELLILLFVVLFVIVMSTLLTATNRENERLKETNRQIIMEYYKTQTQIFKALNDLGGCDAKEEYWKGYDHAIDAAINEISKIYRR